VDEIELPHRPAKPQTLIRAWVTSGKHRRVTSGERLRLCFTAAGLSWWLVREKRNEMTAAEHAVWHTLCVGFALLGVDSSSTSRQR
jgi:hypothetical protein